LHAGGVTAELLKTGIADGDGSPRTIKLELQRIVSMKVSFRVAGIKLRSVSYSQMDGCVAHRPVREATLSPPSTDASGVSGRSRISAAAKLLPNNCVT
jgi:hypothetical protein